MMKVYQLCSIYQDPEDNYYDVCEDVFAVLPKDGFAITASELDAYLEGMNNSFKDLPVYKKVKAGQRERKQLYIEREVEMPINDLEELEKLKEIEKRYGLPLPILFDLLEGKIKRVYVKEFGRKVKLWDKLGDYHPEEAAATGWALQLKWFKVRSLGRFAHPLDFKDFGKTWFLEKPKEEKEEK